MRIHATSPVPPGQDPAELLHNAGPAVLRASLDAAAPLAEKVIADRTAGFADRLDTIEGRVHTARRAADVIGALPAASWLDRANATADQFGVAHHTVLTEVLDRGHGWTEDPRGLARQRVAERLPEPARPPATPVSGPTQRWAALAATIGAGLAGDPHWPVLAEHLTRRFSQSHGPGCIARNVTAGSSTAASASRSPRPQAAKPSRISSSAATSVIELQFRQLPA